MEPEWNSRYEWQQRSERNEIRKQIGFVREAAEALVAGDYHSLIVTGPPGVGKNRLFDDVFRAAGIEPIVACPNSNLGLIEVLHDARSGIVLFDEADKVWNSSTINTLKKALDTTPKNRVLVNNIKGKRKSDEEKDHTNGRPFKVRCRTVFLSNKNLNDLSQWDKKVHQHIPAIVSRVPVFTISGGLMPMWEYTCYLAICEGLLKQQAYSRDIANAALSYLTETMWKANDASPRRLEEIAKAIRVHPKSWRDVLDLRLPPAEMWRSGHMPEIPQIG